MGQQRGTLALMVALLLVGFALRARQITALPLYQDETYHLRRAQAVMRFADNPIAYAHGKLLLYYWIGLFRPAYTEAGLAAARLGVALTGLLAAAGSAALARTLSGRGAALLALGFVVFAPWALFYDRLAMSDTPAAALAVLAGWWTLAAIRRPTHQRGIALGALLGLALLAKLSTAPLLGLPPLAALLFGGEGLPLRERWARARPALLPAAAIVLAVGGLYALGALENALSGRPQEPYDPELFDAARGLGGARDNLRAVWEASARYLSRPLVIALPVLAAALVWRRPRAGVYLLAWLLGLSVPFIAFAVALQTRYFVPALPVLGAIFGAGWIAPGKPERRPTAIVLGAGALAIWALGFALPFARTLSGDPAALDVAAIDRRNFFRYTSNAWGTREAIADLEASGNRLAGRVPLIGAMHYCTLPALYITPAFDWTCMDARFSFLPQTRMPDDVYAWPALIDAVRRQPFTYLLTDYLPPERDPSDDALGWEPVAAYRRPQGEQWVTVWRVTLVDPAALARRLDAPGE